MTTSRIRVKIGAMELEYEGDPPFLTDGLPSLLSTMGELAARAPAEARSESLPPSMVNGALSERSIASQLSTNSIAAHINAKTGPELIISAMAQIEIVQKKPLSVRSEILSEMKGATEYFNENMVGNLSSSLGSLVKAKRINQLSKDTYALHANERRAIGEKIAAIR